MARGSARLPVARGSARLPTTSARVSTVQICIYTYSIGEHRLMSTIDNIKLWLRYFASVTRPAQSDIRPRSHRGEVRQIV